VLIDEPSAGLAPKVVEELFETLRQINAGGVTMLLVEQNVTFGLKLVNTAHIMQRGRIVYQGEVASLDRERVAEYLGIGRLLSPGMAQKAEAHTPNGTGEKQLAGQRRRPVARPSSAASHTSK
jgi:ABC-type multidrug transport system ATPase subunit